MAAHTPMAGTAIDRQLQSAQDGVDRAAGLNRSRWGHLDQAVHGFVVALRAGHAPTDTTVVDVSTGCQQFAPTTTAPRSG